MMAMRIADMVALVVVIAVCIVAVVGALMMSYRDRESARLTERAQKMLEEGRDSNAVVSKQVCLELLIGERRYGEHTSGTFRSGMTWTATLNSIAGLLSLVVLVRATRGVLKPSSRDQGQ